MISDTHGLLRESAIAALRGVRHILHAGDVGSADVLAGLAAIAPVTAVRGNNDHGAWADVLPGTARIELGRVRIVVVHDRNELGGAAAEAADVVVSGHSHRPFVQEVDGRIYLNPGSAGPRRFRLPVALARLSVSRGRARAEIVVLE